MNPPQPLPTGTHQADSLNIQDLRTKFKSIDRNGDGVLEKDELVTLLQQSGMDAASAAKHAVNFFHLTESTANNDATKPQKVVGVTYSEFVSEYVRMTRFKALKSIQTRFKEVDTNGDGVISKAELLATLIQQVGEVESNACIDTVFQEMDVNRSGSVDLKAFWQYYRAKSSQILEQQQAEEAK